MANLDIGDRIEATLPDGSRIRGTICHFNRLGQPFVIPEGRRLPFFAQVCRLVAKEGCDEGERRRRQRMSEFDLRRFYRKTLLDVSTRRARRHDG